MLNIQQAFGLPMPTSQQQLHQQYNLLLQSRPDAIEIYQNYLCQQQMYRPAEVAQPQYYIQQANPPEDHIANASYIQANMYPSMAPQQTVIDPYGQNMTQNWQGMPND